MATKLTSKDPVIYRQGRLGQFGTQFECLKFRTMYANNDPKIRKEYIQHFIAGRIQNHERFTGDTARQIPSENELG